MAGDYDTPEDEEDAANEREKRRQAAEERKLDADMFGYDSDGGVFNVRWTEADFVYDPLSKKGFE